MTNINEEILVEENVRYRFDFSSIEYVWEMHDVMTYTSLSDVDFITETGEVFCLLNIKMRILMGQ